MSTQFLSKLSQNYIKLLEDNEYYDITIEVGEDPNVKIFRAHMNILLPFSVFTTSFSFLQKKRMIMSWLTKYITGNLSIILR